MTITAGALLVAQALVARAVLWRSGMHLHRQPAGPKVAATASEGG